MNNSELFPFIEETVDDKVDEIFSLAHSAFGKTSYGDIAPEQVMELDSIKEKLCYLILEQVIQNVDTEHKPVVPWFDVYHEKEAFIRYHFPDIIKEGDKPVQWVLVSVDLIGNWGHLFILMHEDGTYSTRISGTSTTGDLQHCIKFLEDRTNIKIQEP
jgi:hypothetical protein